MTSSHQKERERSILDSYLAHFGLKGEVVSHERPDFVVIFQDRRVGVEITEYHQPAYAGDRFSRKQVEAEWERIKTAVEEYRDEISALDRIAVLLTFIGLLVPKRREHPEFIRAVYEEIERVQSHLTSRFTTIHIGCGHPKVLSQHLQKIEVRIARGYREWEWNHNFSYVGTSDEELLGLLGDKIGIERPSEIDELHLVVAGNGPSGGTYIGYLSPEWLEGYASLNKALRESSYKVVAIINYEEIFVWRRGQGWSV